MNEAEFLASQGCNVKEIALALRMSEARVRKRLGLTRHGHPAMARTAAPPPDPPEWLALLHRCWSPGAGGIRPATI